MMAGVEHKHPKAVYTGLNKSIRQEWVFVQRTTKGLGYNYRLV